jgi:hypothetical protein
LIKSGIPLCSSASDSRFSSSRPATVNAPSKISNETLLDRSPARLINSASVIIGNGAIGGACGIRYNRNHFELTLTHRLLLSNLIKLIRYGEQTWG